MPNWSFENGNCPNDLNAFDKVNKWLTYNSSNYFHKCATDTNVLVPQNFVGKQYPKNGDAYSGITGFFLTNDFREYIAVKLKQKLTVNAPYCLKF
ncbi:MAG: hypothetical protein ABEH43_01640, partial [Flavobacteriales bacterium]